MRFIPVLFSLFCIAAVRLYGQCPTPDFDIPVSTCLQSLTEIENLSSPADSYSWDFCTGDLSNTPQAQASFILPAANGRPGIEFAKDGNTWFGFVTGTWSNTLYRIEFANGTDALPTATENLGSLSGSLNGPGPIEIINEAGRWYGFVYNASSGELLKLDFGNSLSNKITVSVIFAGSGSINAGIALGKDQSNGWVCVLSTSSNQFKIIRLGNLISLPGPGDIIISGTIPNPNNLGDVDIINVCGMWYGFADNLGNGNLYRLDFGTNLFSVPVINQINTISAGNSGRLSIVKEGEEYFLFVIALDGTLTKLEFGKDLTSIPVIIQEGDIGGVLQANTYGIGLAKENSAWTVMAVSQSNGQVYHIIYPNICGATPRVSNQMSPEVTYAQAGVYKVSLESTYALGTSTKIKSISVSSSIAPDISFASQNICTNHDVNFTSQNTSGNITGYNWDFGDANTSMVQNPTHQYATASVYEVSLKVTASNGCNNLTRESITIYNQPIASFDLPLITPTCTNQEYLFSNTSSFDVVSNPTWEWSLNGNVISTTKDLLTQFSTTSAQEVKLKSSIPGCESESIQNVSTVLQGPTVDFNTTNGCQESPLTFTNNTSGTVTGYTWDFGDGNQSSLVNPTNTFLSHGNFDVVLTAANAAGCENSKTKSITIYSKPQPDFSLDLPPFSCSGSASQFNDLTPSLTDSNITTWTWNFGDAGNGASSQKNPTYVYGLAGDYQVALETSTNFGCSNVVQKTVTISPAPIVDFSHDASCLNQGTQFYDTSRSNVKAWLWSMQNSTYSTKNPIHNFNSTGDQSVTLAVTGNNNCVSQMSKTLFIPTPVSVDFTAQSACATKPSIFQETTTAGPDPATAWSWDIGGTPAVGSPVQHVFQNVGNYNVQLYSTRQS
nr:PKD domain-containing protein [Bacteroidia bacterium]